MLPTGERHGCGGKLTPADPDDQAGLWPAVWASSWTGDRWPRGGEMDWLEVMTAENPRRSMHSIHYADPSADHALKNRGAYSTATAAMMLSL